MELLNCQSLTTKASFIHNYIFDQKLDFMCLTETWHKSEVYSALNEACPPGYSYLEKARGNGRGGGLAVIYRSDFHLSLVTVPKLSSFECLAFRCDLPTPFTTILIYRPPKSHPCFIAELTELLLSVSTTSNNVEILGDFNIHVESPTSLYTTELLQLFDSLNLRQLVTVPTHIKGHTLDLIVTNFPVNSVHVHDLGISDHNAISFDFSLSTSLNKPKHKICFRKTKEINLEHLSYDLQKLTTSADHSTTDTLVDHYNIGLKGILDAHAPLKTRTVTFTRSAPWYTDALRRQKAAGRVLERRYVATGLTVHKIIYREHQRSYSKLLSQARSQYYSNIINNNPRNPKQLFKTVNYLLSPSSLTHKNNTDDQCNKFLDFFNTKITTIRANLQHIDRLRLSYTV